MLRCFIAGLVACLATISLAKETAEMPSRVLAGRADAVPEFFRAAQLPAVRAATLPAPAVKTSPYVDKAGRLRIGTVRPLGKAAAITQWSAIADGAVTRLTVSSAEAQGLRVRLDLGPIDTPVEIRAQGTDGHIELMRVEPPQAAETWTPWTPGATQLIEIFSAAGPLASAVSVTSVVHFDDSPLQKATAASCTVSTACTTNDPTLDAAVADRAKSSVRIVFIEDGSGFLCSATLINTERFPTGYLLTANHCIDNPTVAGTATMFWFYQPTSCTDVSLKPGSIQQAGGTTFVFTNYNADTTLLQLPQLPPNGAVYAGWNAEEMNKNDAVVSISHPRGDTSRLANGSVTDLFRINDRSQDEYGVSFARGIIEGGSSGSGIYTLSGGTLQLRGVLTGTTVRNGPDGMSCTDLDEYALYGRMDIFYPSMAQYLRAGGPVADDTPNRVIDYAGVAPEASLNGRTVNYDRRIDYIGDVDVFRFTLASSATVNLSTQGSVDTIGTLFDADGAFIETNDDSSVNNTNFGINRTLGAGTYYVMVAPWDPQVTGAYRLVMTASGATQTTTNYTDLWWNSSEAGWGINLAHQGDTVFATLYTYDFDGSPLWLFADNAAKQSDGAYQGNLYRATGPVFNASPWFAITPTMVGTMRLTFTSASSATLAYSVNGLQVVKGITRYSFSTPTTCIWVSSDRSTATNYQDLWWNPSESGWGVNLAHQGNILFATLYTYDASGKALWLSMSNGALIGPRTYQGALYSTVGPPFNASPWGAYTATQVGTMTFQFNDGKSGTLTYSVNGVTVVKPIQRYEFSNPKPQCTS